MRVSFLFLVVNMTAVAWESQECDMFKDVQFYTILNMGHFWTFSIASDHPQCKEPWRWEGGGGRGAKSEAFWPAVGCPRFSGERRPGQRW